MPGLSTTSVHSWPRNSDVCYFVRAVISRDKLDGGQSL